MAEIEYIRPTISLVKLSSVRWVAQFKGENGQPLLEKDCSNKRSGINHIKAMAKCFRVTTSIQIEINTYGHKELLIVQL